MIEYKTKVSNFEIVFTTIIILATLIFLGYKEMQHIEEYKSSNQNIEISK